MLYGDLPANFLTLSNILVQRMSILTFATLAITSCVLVGADLTTTIDPTSNWGTWEGWGVSLAWLVQYGSGILPLRQ